MNKVAKAFAFGSVAKPTLFHDKSDVDILISFEDGLEPIEYGENYFKILYGLESILQRNVDLLTERSLKNPYFKREIENTRVQIYES